MKSGGQRKKSGCHFVQALEMLSLIRQNLNKDLKEVKEQEIWLACCLPQWLSLPQAPSVLKPLLLIVFNKHPRERLFTQRSSESGQVRQDLQAGIPDNCQIFK